MNNTITLRAPKYRPSLSADEIADCIAALEQTNPLSSALASLRLFQMKQSLGRVVPTNNTAVVTSNRATKDNPTAEDFAALTAQIFADVAASNNTHTDSHLDQPRSAHNLEDIL